MPDVIQPIATLLAAFSGAGFAFLLVNWRTRRDERKRHIGAINRALIVLLNRHSKLVTYGENVIEEYAGRSDAWLNAPAKPAMAWEAIRFDYDALAFLTMEKHSNLFAELVLSEDNFDELTELIRMRNALLIEEVHPKIGQFLGRPTTEADLVQAFGPHIGHQLKQLWTGIGTNLSEQITKTKQLHDKLRDAAVGIYPGYLPDKVVFFDDFKNLVI